MKILKKVYTWLRWSSVNPTETALTVKGFLTALVPFLVIASGMFNIHTDTGTLLELVEVIVNLILQGLTLAGMLMSAYGLFRKVVLSINN